MIQTLKICLSLFVFCYSSSAFAETYEIDPSHTQIIFKIKHLAISTVTGQFSDVSGEIVFDKENLANSSVTAKITTDSIDTNNKKRDDHLRSPDFFEAKKYENITFKSKSIEDVSDNTFTILGDISIHGVTKEIRLVTEFTGAAKDPWGNERIAFSANTKLNRKDYGLTWNKLLETGGLVVGEEVSITIDIEAIKKK